jgi:hypothetical protein
MTAVSFWIRIKCLCTKKCGYTQRREMIFPKKPPRTLATWGRTAYSRTEKSKECIHM